MAMVRLLANEWIRMITYDAFVEHFAISCFLDSHTPVDPRQLHSLIPRSTKIIQIVYSLKSCFIWMHSTKQEYKLKGASHAIFTNYFNILSFWHSLINMHERIV